MWQYAALSELVYRRATYDLPIELSEIDGDLSADVPESIDLNGNFNTGLDGY